MDTNACATGKNDFTTGKDDFTMGKYNYGSDVLRESVVFREGSRGCCERVEDAARNRLSRGHYVEQSQLEGYLTQGPRPKPDATPGSRFQGRCVQQAQRGR